MRRTVSSSHAFFGVLLAPLLVLTSGCSADPDRQLNGARQLGSLSDDEVKEMCRQFFGRALSDAMLDSMCEYAAVISNLKFGKPAGACAADHANCLAQQRANLLAECETWTAGVYTGCTAMVGESDACQLDNWTEYTAEAARYSCEDVDALRADAAAPLEIVRDSVRSLHQPDSCKVLSSKCPALAPKDPVAQALANADTKGAPERQPAGMGAPCSDAGGECAPFQADFCMAHPDPVLGYCSVTSCTTEPDSCPLGFWCCDFGDELSAENVCVAAADYGALVFAGACVPPAAFIKVKDASGAPPTGMGRACRDNEPGSCGAVGPTWCVSVEGIALAYCTLPGCGTRPDTCPDGYTCCNLDDASAPGYPSVCVTDADFSALADLCDF